ncbi:MAG: hypothetical protein PHP35_02505 [Candidatus Colwellbacteria bacterium]|nr:hypothetical protein [Candidatus Colwellbacteria bacterium]
MDKKIIFWGVVAIIAIIITVGIVSYLGIKKDAELIYLYYSDFCPHCKTVENYIVESDISSRLKIVSKEVSQSKENASELYLRAGECGYKVEEVGVPMLLAGGKCFMGDQPIIDYFESGK